MHTVEMLAFRHTSTGSSKQRQHSLLLLALLLALLLLLGTFMAYLIGLPMCEQMNAAITGRLYVCRFLCCDSDPICCAVRCHVLPADARVLRVKMQPTDNLRLVHLQRHMTACCYGYKVELLLLTHAATSVKQGRVVPTRQRLIT